MTEVETADRVYNINGTGFSRLPMAKEAMILIADSVYHEATERFVRDKLGCQ